MKNNIKTLTAQINALYTDSTSNTTYGGWEDTIAGSNIIADITDNNTGTHTTWWTDHSPPETFSGYVLPDGVSETDIVMVDGEPITIGEMVRLLRKMAYLLQTQLDAYDVGEALATGKDDEDEDTRN